MKRVLDRLPPHPHRGDVIAAGAVLLALAALLVELRMRQWSLGPLPPEPGSPIAGSAVPIDPDDKPTST